jgi:hypothetical protein
MDGLTVGRMVHFVCGMVHRAAIVIDVQNAEKGLVTLFVLSLPIDGRGGIFMNINTEFSETWRDSTWHWIEKA